MSVCPIINKVKVDNNPPQAYVSINKDDFIRLDSSSGGIFTLIAEKTINDDGVVFGAGYTEKFEVKHKYVDNIEKLAELRGSKYVQSKIGNTYKEAKDFLDMGRKVLFSGTPCQIAGLKSYLNKSYDNLITQDFICHGVPSPKVWRKYVEFRETEAKSKVSSVSFRNKDEGWKKFSVNLSFQNDMKYRKNLRNDPYLKAFLRDVCLRPSCYDCEFKGMHRQSDVTLADFWGIENFFPNLDDDKGASLVIVNSEFGIRLFNSIKPEIEYHEVDLDEVIKYNSAAIKSSEYNPKRDKFLSDLDHLQFNKLVYKYCEDSLVVKLKRRAKRELKKILR
ncbi:Coenzyme F420 hydrogenase/dehydrogenase, beta subunit C-terminal domain [Jeotgalibaca porci]|uniref:Coenzyme F420 hydrogenase/dehydrogenase, beta subunit C-terminal domain n=1 Tax=Jeotgalibaca porci TaxID=1868793 RepID=UPI003F933510